MMRTSRRPPAPILALTLALTASCAAGEAGNDQVAAPSSDDRSALPALADHHVHLLSDSLVADWKSLGVPFSRADSAYTDARVPVMELVRGSTSLEPTGASAAKPVVVLLPMAHLYGNQGFREALGLSLAEEEHAVARENDHVLRQAELLSGSAVAACGVDVLRPYAVRELERCLASPVAGAIKLHLASASVDLRDAVHLEAVASALRLASAREVAVWIHLDTQSGDLDRSDIVRFAETVLQPYPDLSLVVAHMGGSGGYGAWTRQVFGALSEWLDFEAATGRPRAGYRFDVSAVWLAEESEGVPASTPEDARAWRTDLERFGTERLLFGTDYPVFSAPSYWATISSEEVIGEKLARSIALNRLR